MKVVNVKKKYLNKKYANLEEWLKNPKHIYIGRNMSFYVPGANKSKWSNPFKLNKEKSNIDEVLELYEQHIRNTPELWNSLNELKNKRLGCWCKPDKCHGDILIKLYREKYGK